jgi:hypothetical protein
LSRKEDNLIEIKIVNEPETEIELPVIFDQILDRETIKVTNPSTPYRTVTGQYNAHTPLPIIPGSIPNPNQSKTVNRPKKVNSENTKINMDQTKIRIPGTVPPTVKMVRKCQKK